MIRSLSRCLFGMLAVVVLSAPVSAQMIVAHRGASHDAPENTLSAFRLAWQQGADGVEGDFYLTADDQIVCIHDRDTKRTAGTQKMVEASTLAELRTLEYGSWKNKKFAGESIPTLDEVIETVPEGKKLIIELKSTLRIVPKLVETLKKHQDKPIEWIVIAFDAPTAAAFKKQMPDVKTHWLTSFKQSTPVSAYQPTAARIAATVDKIGVDGVGMNGKTEVIDAEFVKALKAGGCPEFHVWTIDDVATAKTFQSLGAMGVTTNVPAVIGAALR
ncbi:putative glycerophosphoryl diester phosphodiesterase 1 [Rubripirellula lacrimiformis]|uniref:Putative glycerophosphoryl diester phosphodiesterase 1 n=1 Tax=Rubripirellula lacrimiformis TaxID=1930273 RepID=A0A517NHG1_9BACT|nr:glycerophosphodiester phosphodiesterase [Rubripirellula lacrimiformis]QDT06562.1 putative glycerophosphoryl diester phosphodiesterase 1 [Rubripirellula lacrimiformis]